MLQYDTKAMVTCKITKMFHKCFILYVTTFYFHNVRVLLIFLQDLCNIFILHVATAQNGCFNEFRYQIQPNHCIPPIPITGAKYMGAGGKFSRWQSFHRRSQGRALGAIAPKNPRLTEHQKPKVGPIPYVLLELLLNEKL